MNDEWFISGCLQCPYSEHTSRPRERCPNDGSVLVRFPGIVPAWRMLEACRAMASAFTDARRARYSREQLDRTLCSEKRKVLIDA